MEMGLKVCLIIYYYDYSYMVKVGMVKVGMVKVGMGKSRVSLIYFSLGSEGRGLRGRANETDVTTTHKLA